jgi:uncharacterized protein (TIGR02285 family)
MRVIIYIALILQIANTWAETHVSHGIEKLSIIWSIIPYAPIHILEGEYKGQGVADQYIKNAQKEMPGYAHHNEIMTPARAWYLIAKGEELVCHPSTLKTTEREKTAYFSDAALITPVIRVLMRKGDWKDRLNSVNKLNIEDYIKANNGVFGIVSQRSYGEKIDQVLAASMASGQKITEASGEYGSRQLYEMLVRGRIDMMLEYPWVSAYFKKISYNQDIEVVNLEIEDFPRFTPAYAACTRNAAGKAIIERLNQFIGRAVVEPENRQRMMNWLDEEEAAGYEIDYLKYFKIAH